MSLSIIRYIKLSFICTGILFSNADHLIFNRITIQPTEAELIAIYNPTNQSIDLSNYYITDATKSSDDAYYYNRRHVKRRHKHILLALIRKLLLRPAT